MTDKEHILNLKDGESYIVPESDYGKAEIFKLYGIYLLFSIPHGGGKPVFEGAFPNYMIDDLIKDYESWT